MPSRVYCIFALNEDGHAAWEDREVASSADLALEAWASRKHPSADEGRRYLVLPTVAEHKNTLHPGVANPNNAQVLFTLVRESTPLRAKEVGL